MRDCEDNVLVHEGEIGQGGMGEVHKVTLPLYMLTQDAQYDNKQSNPTLESNTDKSFARKVVRPFVGATEEDIRNEVRAIDKLCRSHHPNITQVLDHGELKPDTAYYYIDMELCAFTLEQYIHGKGPVPGWGVSWESVRSGDNLRENVVRIFRHIVNGLIFIHEKNEVHRDLSPQNGIPDVL